MAKYSYDNLLGTLIRIEEAQLKLTQRLAQADSVLPSPANVLFGLKRLAERRVNRKYGRILDELQRALPIGTSDVIGRLREGLVLGEVDKAKDRLSAHLAAKVLPGTLWERIRAFLSRV